VLDEERLSNIVEEMSLVAGIAVPRIVIVPGGVNAAACGRDAEHVTLIVGRALAAALAREQLEGLIAHLIASVADGDMMRITRYYCPTAHETFSLLPDCLASRFPGDHDDLERVVAYVDAAPSVEAAADILRPDSVLPSAVRWVRRRLTLVRATLLAVVTLLPDLFRGDAHVGAVRAALETDHALVLLRGRAAPLLAALPRPLGFGPQAPGRRARVPGRQHRMGADSEPAPG
jgi:hypothetical protein